MFKNGLFVLSLGFLFFVYSVNAVTGSYNWPNLLFSFAIIGGGIVITRKGWIKDKKIKKE